ncbi:MAG: hypothetical protein ACRC23_01945 [Aeromonas jandaei]
MNKKVENLVEEKFKKKVEEHIVSQIGVPTQSGAIDMEAKKVEVEDFFRSMIAEIFANIIKNNNAGISEEDAIDALMKYCEENYKTWVDSFINAKKLINPELFKSNEISPDNKVVIGDGVDNVVITNEKSPAGNIIPSMDVETIEKKPVVIDGENEDEVVDPNAGNDFDPIAMLKNLSNPTVEKKADNKAGNLPHSMKFEL